MALVVVPEVVRGVVVTTAEEEVVDLQVVVIGVAEEEQEVVEALVSRWFQRESGEEGRECRMDRLGGVGEEGVMVEAMELGGEDGRLTELDSMSTCLP